VFTTEVILSTHKVKKLITGSSGFNRFSISEDANSDS